MSRLPASCFGKLPIHGDFIRHQVPAAEIDALDQWIQGGLLSARSAVGTGWEQEFDAVPPSRFLYCAPQSGRVMAGVFAASQDRTGRRFPFLIFTMLDPRSLGTNVTLLPTYLAPFMDRAEEAAVQGWQGKDLRSFLGSVDGLSVTGDAESAKKSCLNFVSGQTNESFWGGLFGSSDDARKYLLVQNLVETLGSGSTPRYALRVPSISGEAEVAFWLELTRRLIKRPGLPTMTFWGKARAEGRPGLTLVFDQLFSKYFVPILWPERESDLLFPLAGDGALPEARVQQARQRFGPVLDDGELRLSTLLIKLTGS